MSTTLSGISDANELDRQTEQKLKEIRQLRNYPAVPQQVRDEVDEIMPWRRLRDDARGDAIVTFVASYIRDEYEKWDDGDREPLCKCGDAECPVKNGQFPAKARPRPGPWGRSPRECLREYIQGHDTVVVAEAWDAFEDRQADIHRDLERARSKLEAHVETSESLLS